MNFGNDKRPCCSGVLRSFQFRLLAFATIVAIIPLFLRRKVRVARRIFIRATPGEIFPLVNDLRNWPAWTEWSRRDEIHFDYAGPPIGVGAIQRWSTARMEGEMIVIQSVENEQVAYTLEMNHGQYRLDGVLALDPIDQGTRVTWLCRWEGGPNPFSRYVDLLMKWCIGRDFEAGLENLRVLVEEGPMGAKLKTDEGS